ncbi:uncharacterized protein LOC111026127 [Momordica charantia]|uniref:Uncharacterized protein LOC111026127 n=1 Tax=Momordica charantia TaxID=3673 RepID=A0A6J1E538_MOMCH|nr:uncharacterized protein LOC111026127 [Momordica charantia]
MWLRGFQRIGHADGGGGSAGLVFSTFARYFSRKRAENLRKINPKLTPQEASLVAQDLYGVVKQHGPLSISNAWIKAQECGVSGLNSKTHMKLMLKWMRGRKMLKLLCNQVGSNKKFLLSTLPDDPQADQLKSSSELGVQREKRVKPPARRRKPSK